MLFQRGRMHVKNLNICFKTLHVLCALLRFTRFFFVRILVPPARMISDILEVEEQRENETLTGVHGAVFLARPLDFTPLMRRGWKQTKVSPYRAEQLMAARKRDRPGT